MKKLFKSLIIGVLALGLVACGQGQENNTEEAASSSGQEMTALERVLSEGKLVVATDADYPPFDFHIMEEGEDKIVGFDMDLAQEIADDLGVELEIVDMDFDSVLSSVSTGLADLAIGAINASPERDKTVDFSDVYYQSSFNFLIVEDDKDKIQAMEDLEGLSVGVQIGSVQEGLAQDLLTESKIVALPKVTELIMQVQSGMVDAVILEDAVSASYISQNQGLAVAEGLGFSEDDGDGGCVVVADEGEDELLAEVNKTIQRLKDENKLDKMFADNVALSDDQVDKDQ